jgi:Flp pilus assembly protein TadG
VSRTARMRGERGSVSLLIVLLVPAMLMAAGLVLDGGRQLQTRRDAAAAAAAAARAAVELSEQELYGHRLDGSMARGRAASELVAQGATGSVEVRGTEVTVTVTEAVDYLILPGSKTVSSTASAIALQGVTAARSEP